MTTNLFTISYPDWDGTGGYEIKPVEELFGKDGRLTINSHNIFLTESAALSVLGLRLTLEVEEMRNLMERKVGALDRIRERLDALHNP